LLFKKSLLAVSNATKFQVTIDKETGRRQACGLSSVKATRATALVQENGTGILTVDGHHYDVFRDMQARQVASWLPFELIIFSERIDHFNDFCAYSGRFFCHR
jgi:hypothetical protein